MQKIAGTRTVLHFAFKFEFITTPNNRLNKASKSGRDYTGLAAWCIKSCIAVFMNKYVRVVIILFDLCQNKNNGDGGRWLHYAVGQSWHRQLF